MSARRLHLSSGFTMPLDAVTETFWWLGKRGSGKSHDCSVFVEELLGAKAQVIVVDPMEAWYGLRSSADGKGPGLSIAIFGGPHGDLPLEPTAGGYMADLAVAERLSMILAIRGWTKADQRRFLLAFIERLMARNSEACHVVIEEAPLFAPQRMLAKGGEALLGQMEELVKLGRGQGIGTSLISQRSASLSKEVSTQTEVLVAHRTPAPQDRAAVREWFNVHDASQLGAAMERLPHLPTGTAIVSSTDFLDFFGEVAFRPRTTFDSSATPKVGQARREARTLADVDLAAIKEQMAETIERAKADDPRELRRRIAELERTARTWTEAAELAAARVAQLEEDLDVANTLLAKPERVEVPVLSEELVIRLEKAIEPVVALCSEVQDRLRWEVETNNDTIALTRALRDARPDLPRARPASDGPVAVGSGRRAPERPDPSARREPDRPAVPRSTPAADGTGLSKGFDRQVLTALAMHGTLNTQQIAIHTGKARSGGYFRNTLGKLRSLGYMEGDGAANTITAEGLAALGPYDPLPTGDALIDWWEAELGGLGGRILRTVVEAYPDVLDKIGLGEAVGAEISGGYFRNTLGKLRSLELLVGFAPSPTLVQARRR